MREAFVTSVCAVVRSVADAAEVDTGSARQTTERTVTQHHSSATEKIVTVQT